MLRKAACGPCFLSHNDITDAAHPKPHLHGAIPQLLNIVGVDLAILVEVQRPHHFPLNLVVVQLNVPHVAQQLPTDRFNARQQQTRLLSLKGRPLWRPIWPFLHVMSNS